MMSGRWDNGHPLPFLVDDLVSDFHLKKKGERKRGKKKIQFSEVLTSFHPFTVVSERRLESTMSRVVTSKLRDFND